jgi:hypothetical protein
MITYARPPKRTAKPRPKSPAIDRAIIVSKSPADLDRAKRIDWLRATSIKR